MNLHKREERNDSKNTGWFDSGLTPRPDAFKHLAGIGELLSIPVERRTIVYRGSESFTTEKTAISWLLIDI